MFRLDFLLARFEATKTNYYSSFTATDQPHQLTQFTASIMATTIATSMARQIPAIEIVVLSTKFHFEIKVEAVIIGPSFEIMVRIK